MKIKGDITVLPVSKGYLLVDTKKCSGCMSCMMACTLAHEGGINLSHARIQIKKNVFGTYPDDDIEQYVCRQCKEPDCVRACPFDALKADEVTGVRIIDDNKCVGCKKCIKACKYKPSRIAYDYERRKALKCDLCQDTPFWNEQGGVRGKQACINVCALQAIAFTRDLPETEDEYEVNLRKSLHYARANFPVDDAGMQPPMEALKAAGLRQIGGAGSAWDTPDFTEDAKVQESNQEKEV
ncbi:MAG: 4Fe-4S dicluster domain-containing protein [Oscillospiraceae bacterium]|nr:4Fe-4S dicluster domain-containing protein [Oscillospiraceae bacterium]